MSVGRASQEDSVRTHRSIDVPPTRAPATKQELTLTFDELALIYKSLQAVKTLGALPSVDELLEDTIQLTLRTPNEQACANTSDQLCALTLGHVP